MRILESSVKLDDYRPTGLTCVRCHAVIDETHAIYGRYASSWFSKVTQDIKHIILQQQVIIIPTIKEVRIPKLTKGYFCNACYKELWAITWRSKRDGHLRHAIDVLHTKPGPIIQPRNDDNEAAPITKGLYAPHAGVKISRKKVGYHEDSIKKVGGSSINMSVIHKDREHLIKDKLEGFNKKRFHSKPAVRRLMKKGKVTTSGRKRGL